VALIAGWLVTRSLVFDRLWWMALVNRSALALFLPLVVLLPLALWRRQARLLVGLLLPLVVFVWLFADEVLPPMASPRVTGEAITAMTFNVLWHNQDYARLAAAIRDADADLVGLHELRPDHLSGLAAELGDAYPYRAVHPVEQYHTISLLSRFPIEAVTPLPDPPFERALVVRVRAGDRPLTVIVAHLTPTNPLDYGLEQLPATVAERFARRADQAEALATAARAADQPVIILCDCNLAPTSEAYTRLQAGLTDSFAAAGWGWRPTMLAPGFSVAAERVDYIWHTDHLQAVDALVGRDGGSDHLPAVARLTWR
jgi:endonuclease/exonuclease/phosphatase (EEP) superfamily protein YafD